MREDSSALVNPVTLPVYNLSSLIEIARDFWKDDTFDGVYIIRVTNLY